MTTSSDRCFCFGGDDLEAIPPIEILFVFLPYYIRPLWPTTRMRTALENSKNKTDKNRFFCWKFFFWGKCFLDFVIILLGGCSKLCGCLSSEVCWKTSYSRLLLPCAPPDWSTMRPSSLQLGTLRNVANLFSYCTGNENLPPFPHSWQFGIGGW